MEILEIPYSALISVPLLYHKSHTVTTQELIEYKLALATITAINGRRITFEPIRDAKLYFEITRHTWLNITPLEYGETEYSVKPGGDTGLKQEVEVFDKELVDLLSKAEALKVFDKGYSKSLKTKNPQ